MDTEAFPWDFWSRSEYRGFSDLNSTSSRPIPSKSTLVTRFHLIVNSLNSAWKSNGAIVCKRNVTYSLNVLKMTEKDLNGACLEESSDFRFGQRRHLSGGQEKHDQIASDWSWSYVTDSISARYDDITDRAVEIRYKNSTMLPLLSRYRAGNGTLRARPYEFWIKTVQSSSTGPVLSR